MDTSDYVIRGGIEGRERLRIISRIMRPTTLDLLRRTGVAHGMKCLEVACGGGDVACDLAEMVGPSGHVVATDIDRPQLEIAQREAQAKGLGNIEYRYSDITAETLDEEFDLVHARFILTHLADPAAAVKTMRAALKRGGVLVVQDIDFDGYFCYPDCPALWRYIELYCEAVRRKGANARIGRQLPSLLLGAGLKSVEMHVVQPAGIAGEVKLATPITMENIAGAVLVAGLASQKEIDELVTELYAYAQTEGTIGCVPRIVEAWGRR